MLAAAEAASAAPESDDDCTAIAYWLGPTEERVAAVHGAFEAVVEATTTEALLATAKVIGRLGEEQSQGDTPRSVRALNSLLAGAMDDLADGFAELADVWDDGSDQAREDATEEVADAWGDFLDAADLLGAEKTECGL